MPSPIAYELRFTDPNAPKHGMNVAVGGAGAFSPYGMLSLRGQVDELERLVDVVYPKVSLQQSVVLVGIHGNDYGAYIAKGKPVSVSAPNLLSDACLCGLHHVCVYVCVCVSS